MITNKNSFDILNDERLNKSFLSATLNDLDISCKIYKGNFYADSFNYFPITEDFEAFQDLYKIQNENSINHLYSDNFFDNFKKKITDLKKINNVYLLGSSPGDNYFSNLIYFLPRLFFYNQDKMKLAIHRNSSNKFRNFINEICSNLNKKITFTFLDDEFYKFKDSYVPQFLKIHESIKILKFFLDDYKNDNDIEEKTKLYISRQNSNYRRILNESDVIKLFKQHNFQIINPSNYEIKEQINLFSKADIVVSPTGSNLANIIFCKKGTKIYEIAPDFKHSYEDDLSIRYQKISEINDLDYYKIKGDSVDVKTHSKIAKKYISKKVLEESSYYKNLIVKISELTKYIN